MSFYFMGNMQAQTVLIKQTVPEDFSEADDDKGPNRNNFSYPYSGFGQHIGEFSHQDDTLISPKYSQSWEIKFGTRGRRKINGLLALGADLEFSGSFHKVNTKDEYAQLFVPASTKKEKYHFLKTGLAPYLQVNFKPKRGNQLGAYLDLGGFSNYLFSRRHILVTKNSNSKETSRFVQKNLQDVEKIEYGFLVRYGRNSWAIYGKYRYSNTFKSTPTINLPRITVGFEYFIGSV